MRILVLAAIATCAFASAAFAAEKTYQVTGPITELTDSTITVEKSGEKWQIARGNAALPDAAKVGDKVTVNYSMTATAITAKETAAKAK